MVIFVPSALILAEFKMSEGSHNLGSRLRCDM